MKTTRKIEPVGISGKPKIAAYLGISVPTLTRLMRADEALSGIVRRLPGGQFIAHRQELEAWLRGKGDE